jgi:hypothetical protein
MSHNSSLENQLSSGIENIAVGTNTINKRMSASMATSGLTDNRNHIFNESITPPSRGESDPIQMDGFVSQLIFEKRVS